MAAGKLALPDIKPAINAVSLPLAGYAGLGAVTAGVLTLIVPHFAVSWHGYAMVAGFLGFPVALVVGQSALLGGPGIASSMGGKPSDDPRLIRLATEAADAVGVPHPTVFSLPNHEPNAFAASGLFNDKPTVAVTDGLRSILTETELGAVLAHEMGHLRHKDVARNIHVAAAVAGLGGIFELGKCLVRSESSDRRRSSKEKDEGGGSMALGLGLMAAGAVTQAGAHLVRMAASRTAEYAADRAAAEVYGADAMVSALRKIEHAAARRPADLRGATAAMPFAHMMISDGPSLRARAGGFWRRVGEALRTHPTVEKRVTALELAAKQGLVPQRRDREWL